MDAVRDGPWDARARQLYRITPDGRVLLRALRREVTELYREVVLGDDAPPETHPQVWR